MERLYTTGPAPSPHSRNDMDGLGPLPGDLAAHYAAADVFVFPSLTDTFGLVMLEALVSGVPVPAFPVSGPLDVIGDSGVGVLDEDLGRAALRALEIDPAACRAYAKRFSWRRCAELFLENLAPLRECTGDAPAPAAELGNALDTGAPLDSISASGSR